jgi:hypothetical protein
MKLKAEGKTEFDRFNNVMGKLLSVSHEEMERRLAADPRGHGKPKKKRATKATNRTQVHK